MRSYVAWAFAALSLVASACSDNSSPSAPCVPECRSGFVCVLGGCVSACNPPCVRGERCTAVGSAFECLPDRSDAGDAATDAQAPADANADAPNDASAPDVAAADTPSPDAPAKDVVTDAPAMDASGTDASGMDASGMDASGMDASGMDASGMDAVADASRPDVTVADVRPTDAAADAPRADASDAGAPVHCGNPGEICCVDISCIPGAECIDGRCIGLSRAAAECDHPGVCPTGYACIGLQFCGERTCYQCGVSRGTVAFGADCTAGSMCASGVCDRGRCTTACTIGSTGDIECAARSAGWICSQRIYGVGTRDGSPEPVGYVTLGSCAQSCARNADCTGGRACLPTANFLTDRINFICNVTTRPGLAGSACERPEQCQSGLCIPGASTTAPLGCTAPCLTNTDCPTTAPVCERLQLITPGGAFQTIRGCLPAMP